jgi:predicted DNA-binding transcriptional regulator YafY
LREWNYPSRIASGGARLINDQQAQGIPMTIDNKDRLVTIDYTNWRGERRLRTIKPIEIEFTHNEWHKVDQWLLRAKDMEKGEVRYFALTGIHAWMPTKP